MDKAKFSSAQLSSSDAPPPQINKKVNATVPNMNVKLYPDALICILCREIVGELFVTVIGR